MPNDTVRANAQAMPIPLRAERELRAARADLAAGKLNGGGFTVRVLVASLAIWSERHKPTEYRPIARQLTEMLLDAEAAPDPVADFRARVEAAIRSRRAAKAFGAVGRRDHDH